MKLLALATTYILSSTQMYLQFPTGSGLPVVAIYIGVGTNLKVEGLKP